MATLTKQIMAVLEGSAYLGPDGLRDYHRANAVKAALRRKDPHSRLSGVREALNQYRVSAWLTESNEIVLRKDGQNCLCL